MQGSVIKIEGKTGTKWAIRFIDQEGVRRYKTIGKRKIDAQKALVDVMNQVNNGDYRELPDITLREFSKKWLSTKVANVRPKTLTSYRQHLDGRISNYFGNRKLKSITTEDVESFKAYLMEEAVSPNTAGKHLLTLKMVLKTAVMWRYIKENPAEYVKRPRQVKPEIDFFTPNEVSKLISATDERFKCLMMTACYSGLRQGELLGLMWGDIDFASNRIYVKRTLQQGKFYEPKSESSKRLVTVPDSLVKALKDHQARQAVDLDYNELELVFPNEEGKPMDGNNLVKRIFMSSIKRADLRRIRWHDLRHSYAAALISGGENPKFVQKQLGHSSIQVTMDIYAHLLPEIEREAPQRLERILVT